MERTKLRKKHRFAACKENLNLAKKEPRKVRKQQDWFQLGPEPTERRKREIIRNHCKSETSFSKLFCFCKHLLKRVIFVTQQIWQILCCLFPQKELSTSTIIKVKKVECSQYRGNKAESCKKWNLKLIWASNERLKPYDWASSKEDLWNPFLYCSPIIYFQSYALPSYI